MLHGGGGPYRMVEIWLCRRNGVRVLVTFAICNSMDGLGEHYAKWQRSEKEKDCMIVLMCGI